MALEGVDPEPAVLNGSVLADLGAQLRQRERTHETSARIKNNIN